MDFRLARKFSPFVGNLIELHILLLHYNEIFGDIPRDITKPRALEGTSTSGKLFYWINFVGIKGINYLMCT